MSAPVTTGLDRRSRLLALVAVTVLHLAAIAGLISAFGVEAVVRTVRSVAAFAVPLPPPPPPPPPPEQPKPRAKVDKPRAAPAPPAPRATPKAIVAPRPKIAIPRPAPSAAPVAGAGSAAAAGAGSAGSGSGAGGRGSGAGAGGGVVQRAEKIGGELRARDFPRAGAAARNGRYIVVRFQVGVDGRVSGCRVVESSGDADADAITCALIERRFRYRPARDAQGNPVADVTGWKQWWWQ